MITNLPKWYKSASISDIKEETLVKRSISIVRLLKNKDKNWFFDCIRIYLHKPTSENDFAHQLFKEFNKDDAMFLEDESELELNILAGSLVAEKIASDGNHSVEIAMALSSASFGIDREKIINLDILTVADKYIQKTSSHNREPLTYTSVPLKYPAVKEDLPNIESFNTLAKNLNSYLKSIEKNSENEKIALERRISILEEESNIHWWIFSAYSKVKETPLRELDNLNAPLLIAFDFAQLITILPPPANSKSFLEIALKNSDTDEETHSLKDYVSSVLSEHPKLTKSANNIYGNLTPIITALIKAEDHGEGWQNAFERSTGVSCDFDVSTFGVAKQMLLECLLHNHYNI